MKVPPWAVALLLFALALGLRLPQLNLRPFHADEAVHAEKFRVLWERGSYRYDPSEFHGPTIYYAALPVVALSGHRTFGELTESDLRRAIALVGAALVPLLLLLFPPPPADPRSSGGGGTALLWAGGFCAISPALVFYSRYFIQEIFLIAFTLGFLAFASRKQPIGAGIFAGLMIATKETAILTFFAALMAYLVVRGRTHRLPWKSLALGAGIALIVAYLTLSGLLREPAAPLGYFQTYAPWLRRAGGAELHAHPWSDYFQRYFWQATPGKPLWTEGLFLLLGILGAVLGWKKSKEVQFVTIFTGLLMGIYALIPYKTPWCGLNFLFPLTILAGFGTAELISRAKKLWIQVFIVIGVLLGSFHLLWLACQTNFVYFTDLKNPYVYSPTLPDAQKLAVRLERIAQAHPDGLNVTVQVISRDGYYWPLPWELRRFKNVGYWTGALPENLSAPIILTSPKFEMALQARLPRHRLRGMHGLRMGVFYDLFVEKTLWDDYQKTPAARLDDDEE